MISPTGKGVRTRDEWGEGHFGASRGDHLHNGTDYICIPGQDIVSPISGVIMREAKPYAGQHYSGCVIEGPLIAIKMFYLNMLPNLVGRHVKQGELLGRAQDISKRYHHITPHIHVRIEKMDPDLLISIP